MKQIRRKVIQHRQHLLKNLRIFEKIDLLKYNLKFNLT